ncbi:MAG: hypothetical protein C0605_05730 [Hyphomicrobiales bacterium]|nr:MAG: hypothetical protein C0605_05730 [Hyphomicrobiales bacterium]
MSDETARHNCTDCPIRHLTDWQNLPKKLLKKMDRYALRRQYELGDKLYHQGDKCHGLFCIRSGFVGLRRYDVSGRSSLIKLAGPGDTLGYRALLGHSTHSNTAEILKASEVCYIDRAIISEILQNHPSVGERFLQRCLTDLERMEAAYLRAKNLTTREQLLHFLMILHEQFGQLDENGCHYIVLPIARKDIAELIGSTPESVSRTIKKLETEHLVQFEGRLASFENLGAIIDQIGMIH